MATAVENPSRIDDKAGRMDFAGDDALGLNLHAAFGEDDAIITARNNHAVPFDLAFDFGVFAEDQRLLGDDVSLHVAVDAERASHSERALHCDALIDETCPLFAIAVAAGSRPLPSHKTPRSVATRPTLAACGNKSTIATRAGVESDD